MPTEPSTSSTPSSAGRRSKPTTRGCGGSRTSSSISAPTCRCPYEEGDGKLRIAQDAVDGLEADCDAVNEGLPELKSFVLPGGSEAAARLHIARAVCRRAESVALWAAAERPVNPLALVYLNRLSDLLFILARAANGGAPEPLWKPGGSR